MILRTTPMSSPAAESGACRPPDAVGAIRKRLRPTGAPSWSTATAGWSVRPARGDRSARSVLLRKTPRLAAGLKGYERSSHAGKITPDSESPITLTSSPDEACLPGNRQVSRKALLQRAARPNFFPSRRNTLSQTLQPFGTRCQPCRCLRSSPVPSVVSATESNPTQSVSPSSFLPPRCHPMVSMRRFPI